MTRVLFLSGRVGDSAMPSGGGAHLAATIASLRQNFDVKVVTSSVDAHPVARRAHAARRLVPTRVRGVRRDLLLATDDRAFGKRALAAGVAFAPDVVYERSDYFARAGLVTAGTLGLPLVLEVNGLFDNDARTMYRSLAEPLGAFFERHKLRRASLVITVSCGLARRLAERGAAPDRIAVVPNTIDPSRVATEPRPVDPQRGNVGFVGHLMPWHLEAVEQLIDVSPRIVDGYPNVGFTIVGGGPGLRSLDERAGSRGVGSRFRFTGVLPQDAVPAEVRRFDVGVIPAIFDYAFPVKLVEMGAAGVPVVAPQSRDLDEMLVPGVEYEPFSPNDPDDFVRAVLRLLRDPERRARLGAALHGAVRDRFTWSASAAALQEAIGRVLRHG